MRRRLRHAFALVLVAGLVGGPVPQARAATAGTVTFLATLAVGPGLAYPCTGTTPFDPAKCPGTGTTMGVVTKTSFDGTPTAAFTFTNANTATFTLSSSACVIATGNVLESAAPVEPGFCTIAASGVITGYCGLATGMASGLITTTTARWRFRAKFGFLDLLPWGWIEIWNEDDPAPKGTGKLGGKAYPDPTNGSSCTNKGPKNFILAAEMGFAIP